MSLLHNNPFTSEKFVHIWSKHFNGSKRSISFEFISGVRFLKHSFLPLYENIGQNLTKGIYYETYPNESDYKGKAFLIYDVPDYFNVKSINRDDPRSSLRLKTVFQYQGFLMDISGFKNQDEYINAQFSSKNRREFRSNTRRLEQCFNIRYQFINEGMNPHDFELLFNQFYALLNRRFAGKQTNYHHLDPKKWNYYKELVFKMLKSKSASFLVIYNNDNPIGITLNFHADNVLFETITVFDPDYYKFSIGKTSIIKLLEWCFNNDYKISDFSKGDYEYKHKWSNLVYDFDYHILYDRKSIRATLVAKYVETYFRTKLFLRNRGVNEIYRKYRFFLKGRKPKQNSYKIKKVKAYEKLEHFDDSSGDFTKVDLKARRNKFLLQYLYTFAFANPEPIEDIRIFKSQSNKNEFVISGSKSSQRITFA